MDIKLPNGELDIDKFIFVGEEPLPSTLPKNLRDVDRLKAMSKYHDDPKLSAEENQKRREYYAKMEEQLKNKKEYTKSNKQKTLDKKRAKIAAKSKRKNR